MLVLLYYILLGYLLGSISPGYFFGRIIKGVDVRISGNKNTGATNTYHIVGPAYGIITGIFDALKASTAYWIAVTGLTSKLCWSDQYGLCGIISPDVAILVGITAVIGHIWPFYLKFRGGRGTASLTGLCITVLFFTQSIFALILIISALTFRIINSEVIIFEAPTRKLLKLGGLIFPLGLIWLPREPITKVAFALFAGFFIFDLFRFYLPKLNAKYLKIKTLTKEKELRRLSGYTIFLFSVLAISQLFETHIAAASLTFFIIGDILAPLGRRAFLPIKFIREKTVGGAFLIFAFAIIAGVFLDSLTPLTLSRELIMSGALATAIIDQFSFLIDDNLLVPIGTALVLAFLF